MFSYNRTIIGMCTYMVGDIMRIAIVGHGGDKFTPLTEALAREAI